jgi:hypothetical protein
MTILMPPRAGLLKVTGQTTQYAGKPDDGFYEEGLDYRYEVLTASQYSGTSNIDLVHLTDTSIAFVAGTKKITDSNSGLAQFKTGETIVVSGSVQNDGVYTVATGGVAGEIVVNEALIDEGVGATASVAKRVAHSNNCVQDLVNGKMYLRYPTETNGVMGPDGNGKLPWDGTPDIYDYVAAANAAEVGGYSDWRIPNKKELDDLCNMEAPNALPDPTAFPSWSGDYHWSSTTRPNSTAYAVIVYFHYGYVGSTDKSAQYYAALVRG